MSLNFSEKRTVLQIIAYFVFGAMGWLALQQVTSMTDSLTDMKNSLNELNQKMAVVVTKQSNNVETIKDHEERIRYLEKKKD